VSLDDFKIQQVFIDVITNALQAMPDQGTLTLRTAGLTLTRGRNEGHCRSDAHRSGDHVAVVEIDDTGTGIPPHVLNKVFDPFFTTKPTGHGTGLGLSVSRQIVEMHGGTIDIANRATGGARVTLTFRLGSLEQPHEIPARIAS
jgi:signal transduction histidine kinase